MDGSNGDLEVDRHVRCAWAIPDESIDLADVSLVRSGMRALGIDIGTTTIKGAVLDPEANRIEKPRSLPFPSPCTNVRAGRHETPVPAIVEVVDELLVALLRDAPEARDLFLCGQMHGIAVLDKDGAARTPFISWKDQRLLEPHPNGAGSYAEVLGERLTSEERAALGNEFRPGLGALTLACLQDERGFPDGAGPMPICETVLAAWTGKRMGLDPTFAASLGIYDLAARCWHTDVMEKWGLRRHTWPEVARSHVPVGEVTRHGRTVTVYPVLGDHQAALLGAGLSEKVLSINISTGSQIAALSPTFTPGPYQTRPFPGGLFLNTFTHLPAGEQLNRLIALLMELPRGNANGELGKSDPWPYIHRETAKVKETSVEVDLAFSSCLTGDEGHLRGLTSDTLNIGHLFRGAYRHMAANYRSFADELDPGVPWETIVLSGGLARKTPDLRDEIERAMECPVRLSASTEETLRGLVELALGCR